MFYFLNLNIKKYIEINVWDILNINFLLKLIYSILIL